MKNKIFLCLLISLLILIILINGCGVGNQALLDEWDEKSAEWKTLMKDEVVISLEEMEDCVLSETCSDETFKELCENYIQKYNSKWKDKIKGYEDFLNNNEEELGKLEINFQNEISRFNNDKEAIRENVFSCNDFLKNYEARASQEKEYCSDGTVVGECSEAKPWLCDFSGVLIPRCDVCGCSEDYSCGADGMCTPK